MCLRGESIRGTNSCHILVNFFEPCFPAIEFAWKYSLGFIPSLGSVKCRWTAREMFRWQELLSTMRGMIHNAFGVDHP